jgi:hypothetical protein
MLNEKRLLEVLWELVGSEALQDPAFAPKAQSLMRLLRNPKTFANLKQPDSASRVATVIGEELERMGIRVDQGQLMRKMGEVMGGESRRVMGEGGRMVSEATAKARAESRSARGAPGRREEKMRMGEEWAREVEREAEAAKKMNREMRGTRVRLRNAERGREVMGRVGEMLGKAGVRMDAKGLGWIKRFGKYGRIGGEIGALVALPMVIERLLGVRPRQVEEEREQMEFGGRLKMLREAAGAEAMMRDDAMLDQQLEETNQALMQRYMERAGRARGVSSQVAI